MTVHEKNIDLFISAQEEMKRSRSFFWIGKITDVNGRLQVEHAIQKAENDFIGPNHFENEIQGLIEPGTRILNGSCFIEKKGYSYPVEDPFIRLDADTPNDLLLLREMMLSRNGSNEVQ